MKYFISDKPSKRHCYDQYPNVRYYTEKRDKWNIFRLKRRSISKKY